MKILLDKGALVNICNSDGSTLLHWAVDGGDENIVRMLLEKGASTNTQDCWGHTPLHIASSSGNSEIIRLLFDKGAKRSLVDKYGRRASKCCSAPDVRQIFHERKPSE